jgi:outer membrane protein OmpA-like peptidoglycan-associated protein
MEPPAQEETLAKLTERGLMMTIDGALFTSGRAEWRSASGAADLDRVVAYLKGHSAGDVIIEGHTDSLGSEGYNHRLSQRRADAVMSYLIEHGVAARRLTALGKGASDPVAGNNTAAGRQRNARVEVILTVLMR